MGIFVKSGGWRRIMLEVIAKNMRGKGDRGAGQGREGKIMDIRGGVWC